jgi:DNA-binding CsgD family transcriptional regulator
MVLADALVAQSLDAESDATFHAALEAAETVDEAISGVTQHAFVLTWRRHDPQEALAVLGATGELVSGPHAKILAAHRTNALLAMNRLDEVVTCAGELLADNDLPGRAELVARTSLSLAAALTGRPQRALAEACLAERVLPRYLDSAAGQIGAFALPVGHHIALLSLGQFDRADRQAEAQVALGEAVDARLLVGQWLTLIGNLGVQRGHAHTARGRLERAVEILDNDVLGLLPLALASLAQAAAVTGDLAGAQEFAAQARRAEGSSVLQAAVQPALAWVDACSGRPEAAVATSLAAAEEARRAGQVLLEARPLHDAARFGAAPRVVQRLRDLARGAEGDWLPLIRDHAEHLAARDPQALEGLIDRCAVLGDRVVAAECAARSAIWYAAAGDEPARIRARRRATQLLARLEPVTTPALQAEVATRLRPTLTPRETEVALLAGQGLTTRAMAERLHVSLRTTENHLHRIYGKLGVSGKVELAHLLSQRE